jgi:flagellar biosynthetic protein FliQ
MSRGIKGMSYEFVIAFGRQAVETMLFVSLPVLGLSMAVGLLISVFQSVTQIQEMTITFVPKIVVTFLALLIFGSWMLGKLAGFLREVIVNIPNLAG